MKRLLLATAVIAGLSSPVLAKDNNWEREAQDAWIDGKSEATLLFNGNLDSFDIDTDVKMGVVTLTGKVDTSVKKQLAEELVMGIEGVKSVNNMLTVMNDVMDEDDEDTGAFTDAKIHTVVASRFMFNSDISGSDIEVEVENGVVTLTGEVDSEAEHDLAATIVKNTNDVKSVNNNLKVKKDS